MPVIASNMYIIIDGASALVIDPHPNKEAEILLQENQVEEVMVVLTHEHYDHISGVNFFRERWKCKVYGNNYCKELVTDSTQNMSAFFMAMFVNRTEEERLICQQFCIEDYSCMVDIAFDGECYLHFGEWQMKLISTPGHSMGSICILIDEQYIFTGDSLVQGAKIITRLPGGSKKLYKEITQPFLESLDEKMIVFPGHGEEGQFGEIYGLTVQ